jgi:hypothetical protein
MVKVYLMTAGFSHVTILLLLAFNLLPYTRDSLLFILT